jgi:hypothetical protein
MRCIRRLFLLPAFLLAACGRGGVGPSPVPELDSVLTLRNVDPLGIAIVWVEITDAAGHTHRSPPVEGLLTLPGMGDESELRVHDMPSGVYTISVMWKSAGSGFIVGEGMTYPAPVAFTYEGEDVTVELEYQPG